MGNKFENFLKDQKLEKALEELNNGDRIIAYNNTYKVLSKRGTSQVIMKDIKDIPIAMPLSRVKDLMKKGVFQKLIKSNGKVISPEAQAKLKVSAPKPTTPRQAAMAERAAGTQSKKEVPVGTVHGGRMKISMNPSRWVDIQSGHSFHAHDHPDPHEPLHHPEDFSLANGIHMSIRRKAHGDDHERLEQMVNEHIHAARQAQNLKETYKVMRQTGQAYEAGSYTEKVMQPAFDKVKSTKKKFLDALLQSGIKQATGEK